MMKIQSINQSIVALLAGVFVVISFACESHLPLDIPEDQLHQEIPSQKFELQDGERLIDAFRNLKIGRLTNPYFSRKMRDLLKEHGIDPYQEWRSEEKHDNVIWLVGDEWNNYTLDWEQNNKINGELMLSEVDPEISNESSVSFLSQSAEPAFTEIEIQNTGNQPSSGSVTVTYQGIQVTTNYTSSWNTIAVANTISHNINNNSNIQLTATVNGSTVRLTEKRDGCAYNGNLVSVSHTNGTHITVNSDSFYMADGHDGEGWCEPVNDEYIPPPPTTINIGFGSSINTNSHTGQVAMGSWTGASQNIYEICVASHSYKDGWKIESAGYCENWDHYVAFGVGTTKDPQAPSVSWQQYGEHLWHINPDDTIVWYNTSYAWTNF